MVYSSVTASAFHHAHGPLELARRLASDAAGFFPSATWPARGRAGAVGAAVGLGVDLEQQAHPAHSRAPAGRLFESPEGGGTGSRWWLGQYS
jgi:hypothetical protein